MAADYTVHNVNFGRGEYDDCNAYEKKRKGMCIFADDRDSGMFYCCLQE